MLSPVDQSNKDEWRDWRRRNYTMTVTDWIRLCSLLRNNSNINLSAMFGHNKLRNHSNYHNRDINTINDFDIAVSIGHLII